MKLPSLKLLLASTSLSVGMAVTPAAAQDKADEALGDIVVTATRQSEAINKVPLSISAVSQETLTNQGIKNADDLSRTVPGMTFRRTGGEGNPNITIRGIGGNGATVGAQTTGVYLDDTALQRRMINGLQTGNGAPFPNLFDLERVEVLRGPQGTLYGDSSQGGTIRFITPTPSLTEYTGRARLEVGGTEGGAASGEVGFAIGGPLIKDTLGFRVSGAFRRNGGWVDSKSVYDGLTFKENNNWSDSRYVRAALKWQVNDNLTIAPALYWGRDFSNDLGNTWGPSEKVTYSGSIIRNGITNPAIDYAAFGATPGSFWNTTGSPTASPGVGSIGYTGANGQTKTYYFAALDQVLPGHTQNAMPWYNYDSNGNGLYRSTAPGDVTYVNSPRTTKLFLPSLTIDNDFGAFSVKSITSYVRDETTGHTFQGGVGGGTRALSRYMFGTTNCVEGYNRPRGPLVAGGAQACYRGMRYLPGFPQYADWYNFSNKREAWSEELRFSSNGNGPLTWVAGAYFSDSTIKMHGREINNEVAVSQYFSGISGIWRTKGYPLPQWGTASPPGVGPFDTPYQDVSDRRVELGERTWAVFAEANYNITDKLKFTLGGRYNDYRQTFRQEYAGIVASMPPAITVPGLETPGFQPDPAAIQAISVDPTRPNSATNPVDLTAVNLANAINAFFPTDLVGCPQSPRCQVQYTRLSAKEKNFTPKVGLSYEFSPTNMAYATIAKGFRPGGVNPPVPAAAQCLVDLQNLNISSSPLTYKQDTVTSYEIGNKIRILNGRVQLNTSAFYIDWKNMQFNQQLSCGFGFINNAGAAVSKGAEIQASGRFGDLTVGANVGYNKATFAKEVRSGGGALVQRKGDGIGVPDWTVALNAQYNFRFGDTEGFIRGDYQYMSSAQAGPGPGTSAYNAWTWRLPSTTMVNARLGVNVLNVDWALFVMNLTNERSPQLLPGNTATSDGGFLTASGMRPRTVGLQANYNF